MNGFAALDIHPHRRYVVDIGGRRSSRCRLHINFALFLHSLDFTQNLGVTLTAFCGIHGGQFLFLSQTIPTSLSLRHLLFNLFRHVNQAKSIEQPIDIRHTPDISQRLGSVHYLSDFNDIVICHPHGTPSKALAALSTVDPQFLGELISPALLQLIGKGQAGQGS